MFSAKFTVYNKHKRDYVRITCKRCTWLEETNVWLQSDANILLE